MDDRRSVNSIAKKHSLLWKIINEWIRKYNDAGLERLKKLEHGNDIIIL